MFPREMGGATARKKKNAQENLEVRSEKRPYEGVIALRILRLRQMIGSKRSAGKLGLVVELQ